MPVMDTFRQTILPQRANVAQQVTRAAARPLALALPAAALLIVALIALQSVHFLGRDYRQDEIITAHAATFRDPSSVVRWMADDIHPPLWRVAGVLWATWFGQAEVVTRFLSTLLSALTLATVYRLAADLFNRRVALAAVFLLGTLAHFQFYSQEFRPYAALMLFAALSQLLLIRWLQQPTFGRAAGFVLSAIALCYTHYFGLFLLAAQALTFVILVRWDTRRYLRYLGLLVATGIGFLPWLLVFLHVLLITRPYGVTYAEDTSYESLVKVHELMQMRPLGLGMFLVLAGLLVAMPPLLSRRSVASAALFRAGDWPRWYLLLVNLLACVFVIIANTRYVILTPRNLSVIVPGLIVLPALALAVLQPRLRLAAVALILLPALFEPQSFMGNGPYSRVLATVQPGYTPNDRVLLNIGTAWWHNGVFADYLTDRLPSDSTQTSIVSLPELKLVPGDPPALQPDRLAAGMARLDDALASAPERVWLLDRGPNTLAQTTYRDLLAERYLRVVENRLTGRTHPTYDLHLYRRIPDATTDVTFGDTARLFSWSLLGSVEVRACDTVTLETWWRALEQPDRNYSMTLTLADESGVGVTRNDSEPAGVLTGQWQAGQTYLDQRSVQVPCDAPAGAYPLLAGWYDYETLAALPATAADGAPLGNLVYLTTLHVAN